MRHLPILLMLLGPAALAEPLFEIKSGSRWVYEVEGASLSTVVNTVSERITLGGRDWYKLTEYDEVFWVANGEQGQVEAVNLYNKVPEPSDVPEVELIFKYPAKVGDSWMIYDTIASYRGKKTMTVPAGTFECHEYHMDISDVEYSVSCIAISVGVIFNETLFEDGRKEIARLVSYQL